MRSRGPSALSDDVCPYTRSKYTFRILAILLELVACWSDSLRRVVDRWANRMRHRLMLLARCSPVSLGNTQAWLTCVARSTARGSIKCSAPPPVALAYNTQPHRSGVVDAGCSWNGVTHSQTVLTNGPHTHKHTQ